MDLKFNNKKISGILAILPQKEILFEDEMANYNFPTAKSKKLAKVMGYKKHCVAEKGQTSADFCMFGLQYLFDNNMLSKDEIDAIVFVSQSPDYIMPPTSNEIQGHFNLKHDMICLDINQGCAGYEIGLIQSFMLLEQEAIKKVVLLNADVMSAKTSIHDRNSYPLIGDAASITIVEKSEDANTIYANVQVDGTGYNSLIIPAGGARLPHSGETEKLVEDESGNFRSKENLVMKGDDVFNFVQREVPPMIRHLAETAHVSIGEIAWFMFHQPNKFMLDKLADAIDVPRDKMPSNIVENFGNSSGVTVPLNISYNLGDILMSEVYKVCLAGFGVGLTWSSILMDLGKLQFNKIINF